MLRLLATGGTIASKAGDGGRVVGVEGTELLERARQVWPLETEVEVVDVAGLVSWALDTGQVLDLARQVSEHLAAADGVVITQGTDTMEEVAFLVALATRGDKPVVFTGAQRPFDDPAPDGPRNLAAALAWAASPYGPGSGTTIVFGDAVLPAVGSHKAHTLELTAFQAPGRGPIGHVDETGARCHARPMLPPLLLAQDVTELPRVEVVAQYVGADAELVTAAVDAGAQGLVIAGLGAGNAPPLVTRELLRHLAEGLPVVMTSRTGAGAVAGLYAGGGADLAAAGALLCGDLSPWQARLLLATVLADGREGWQQRMHTWLQAAGALS